MTAKTKKILGAVVALAVIGSVVGFSVSRENRKKITVQTGKVEKKSLTQVVTASGEVRPRRYVNVGANVSGRLIDITVLEGQRVKKGQMLARVEAERYEAGARQAEAGVAAARAEPARTEADVAGAKLAYDRNKRMREEKLVAESAYDQAEAEYKMKTANVEAAKRRVAQLQAQLDSTRDELYKTTVILADGRGRDQPAQGGGRDGDRRAELQPDRDHDRRRPVGDGVRGDGRRDRLPQPQARPGGEDQGRRARGARAEGRGHRDRRLGARARQRQPGQHPDRRRAPTPATSRRTSRSRSRSRTRP